MTDMLVCKNRRSSFQGCAMSTAWWEVAAVTPAQPFEDDRQIAKVSPPSESGNLTHLSSFLSMVAQPAYEMHPGRLGWKPKRAEHLRNGPLKCLEARHYQSLSAGNSRPPPHSLDPLTTNYQIAPKTVWQHGESFKCCSLYATDQHCLMCAF